ncbi:TPA: hypothetical protein ACMDN4_002796 [Vibrio cholerae]|nr:hypothetical protein [Vibrio vulnificus]TXZ86849.1 hypothetical protein FXE50_10990 [Vibrio cholerae]GHY13845.1 hypothetical protein VCSRO21_2757 [Vibrio cholerae]
MIDKSATTKGFNLTRLASLSVYPCTLLIMYFSWPIISQLKMIHLQPIASTVATFAGILFGFAMGSITLLTSSSHVLVENTKKTGYLKTLTSKLHSTMGWLLAVCVVFLITMFIPDSLTLNIGEGDSQQTYLYACLFAQFGVGILIIAFKEFYVTWREFKKFSNNL